MKIHQLLFSPTGGTRRVSEFLCEGLGKESILTDLCVKEENIHYPSITEEDLVLIAMPVYGGRVPALAVKRLKKVESRHAKCVIIAVYGNRAYDDALIEMLDIATDMGFRVIAAIGASAEHSIVRKYGIGRPDTADAEELKAFAASISHKIATGNLTIPSVPGNRPYKKLMAGPHPTANNKCNACGLCAKGCPVGAIDAGNPRSVNKDVCISCMRCAANCPSHARGISKIMNFLITQALKKPCASRKQNELFL